MQLVWHSPSLPIQKNAAKHPPLLKTLTRYCAAGPRMYRSLIPEGLEAISRVVSLHGSTTAYHLERLRGNPRMLPVGAQEVAGVRRAA